MCQLEAISVTRHKTSELIRDNSNAWTEVNAFNRCARFPASVRRRAPHGGGCPASLSGVAEHNERLVVSRRFKTKEIRRATRAGEHEPPRVRFFSYPKACRSSHRL
jgi:hypothetical protein